MRLSASKKNVVCTNCAYYIIYASNEENALLAETFDEYRDNGKNSQSEFLPVYASNEENTLLVEVFDEYRDNLRNTFCEFLKLLYQEEKT